MNTKHRHCIKQATHIIFLFTFGSKDDIQGVQSTVSPIIGPAQNIVGLVKSTAIYHHRVCREITLHLQNVLDCERHRVGVRRRVVQPMLNKNLCSSLWVA